MQLFTIFAVTLPYYIVILFVAVALHCCIVVVAVVLIYYVVIVNLTALLEARGLPSHWFGALGPRMQQLLQRSMGNSSTCMSFVE